MLRGESSEAGTGELIGLNEEELGAGELRGLRVGECMLKRLPPSSSAEPTSRRFGGEVRWPPGEYCERKRSARSDAARDRVWPLERREGVGGALSTAAKTASLNSPGVRVRERDEDEARLHCGDCSLAISKAPRCCTPVSWYM